MKKLLLTLSFLSSLQIVNAGNSDPVICDSVEVKKFREIIASSSLNVILVNSNLKYAYIEGTAAAISSVQIKQIGDVLYVSRKGSARKGKVFVYLPVRLLRNIEATDGAKVSSYDPVRGDTLTLSAYYQSSISILSEASVIRSSSGKSGSVELIEICDYSFDLTVENGISFVEFRKNGYKENF